LKNTVIGKIGAALTGVAIVVFAVSMLIGIISGQNTKYLSFFVSMIIAMGYLMLAAGVASVNTDLQKTAAGYTGLAFGTVYAVLIFIVYYAELTTVRLNDSLSAETLSIISYSHTGSLFFNFNLLGYGFMALSTFFIGFTVRPKNKCDRAFQALLWIHGVFFLSCLIMPMTGVFTMDTPDVAGIVILEFWCVFFLPICILGWKYLSCMARNKTDNIVSVRG